MRYLTIGDMVKAPSTGVFKTNEGFVSDIKPGNYLHTYDCVITSFNLKTTAKKTYDISRLFEVMEYSNGSATLHYGGKIYETLRLAERCPALLGASSDILEL